RTPRPVAPADLWRRRCCWPPTPPTPAQASLGHPDALPGGCPLYRLHSAAHPCRILLTYRTMAARESGQPARVAVVTRTAERACGQLVRFWPAHSLWLMRTL